MVTEECRDDIKDKSKTAFNFVLFGLFLFSLFILYLVGEWFVKWDPTTDSCVTKKKDQFIAEKLISVQEYCAVTESEMGKEWPLCYLVKSNSGIEKIAFYKDENDKEVFLIGSDHDSAKKYTVENIRDECRYQGFTLYKYGDTNFTLGLIKKFKDE